MFKKIKIIKKRKEEKRKKEKKLNSTELQNPKIYAEVYSKNKMCD